MIDIYMFKKPGTTDPPPPSTRTTAPPPILFPANKKAPPPSTKGQEPENKIDYGLVRFVLGICSVLGTLISVTVQGNRLVFTIIFHYIYLCFSFSGFDLS